MPCWPVSYRDGKYQVTDSDGILCPITMAHEPVDVFNPGWVAAGLQTGLPPFHLLELHHDGPPDMDAVWYLTDDLDFIANTPKNFSPAQALQVTAGLSPLLRDIYDETICAPQPAVAASSHAFDGINPIFVREMIGFVVETALSPPDVVMVPRLESVSAHYTADGTRLSTSLLRHSLDVTMPNLAAAPIMLASPFDATLLTVQEQFRCGGAISQVHRFYDPTGRMTLHLLFQKDGAPALYFPSMNTVFTAEDGLSGAEVMSTLLSYYASHTGMAEPTHEDEAWRPEAASLPDEQLTAGPPPYEPFQGEPRPADVAGSALHPQWWKRLLGLGNP